MKWDVRRYSLPRRHSVGVISRYILSSTRIVMMTSSFGNIFRVTGFLSPVTGEFPAQGPVTQSFDVFFDLGLDQQFSKQWRRRRFETPWRSLWRHCNVLWSNACGQLGYKACSSMNAFAYAITMGLTVNPGCKHILPLLWRHNGRDGIWNHQPHDCLLSRLFRCRSKKTSKLRVTGLFVGNSPVTGEFPPQMASDVENASIWWRHHAFELRCSFTHFLIIQ